MKSVIPDVVKEELKEKAAEENKPAIIKKKDLKMLYDKTYDKVIRTMMERPDFNSVIYEEKNKKKFDEFGKKIRNNRDDHGKKKKYRKKDRAAKFWNKN